MSEGKKRQGKGRKKMRKKEKERKKQEQDLTEATAPKIKQLKNQSVVEGNKLLLKCEASGKPTPEYKWYRDGSEFKKSKAIKIKSSKKNSRIQINRVRLEDSGNYTCVAENMHGRDNSTSTVNVQSSTTTLSPGSGHARRCNDTERAYCVNGGDCYFIHGINQLSCKCPSEFFGPRCLQTEPLRLYMPKPYKKAEELYKKRVLTITGICVALLVVGIVCVVAYCKTKKQRKKMHGHLRQNMCPENPNRNLANGPNHPGPGPEEIPMVDYISKNVPATERVIRHGAGTTFSGSRASSRSHQSSTVTHSSSHRYVSALTTPRPPLARGLPLLTASTGAYVPDHVSQRQPRPVPPSRRCRPDVLPGGRPAAAPPLPSAPAGHPAAGGLPPTAAAAAPDVPKRQHGQPALQPLPASGRRGVRDHAGVRLLAGATKEKRARRRQQALAEVQTQRACFASWRGGRPELQLPELPVGQRFGGRGGAGGEHALPQYAEHERRARRRVQAGGQPDLPPVGSAQLTRQRANQTDALSV
ncbi:hypothetical protein SKAU_G00364110 [Synaphobranchus kaupii]|uniref:Neuregulin 2 n=1 Tax=Synaphobranchus kaupii TaxID=118154 RepID=A0A9Q1EEQ9_SYNKA|nr:hypothetical protein SKAU_G00364110 [Synaphobranchus kaupii]